MSIGNKDEFEDAFDRIDSFTTRKKVHKIVSFSVIFVDNDGKLIFEKTSLAKNAGECFFKL